MLAPRSPRIGTADSAGLPSLHKGSLGSRSMKPLAGGRKSDVLATGLDAVEVPLANTSENVDDAKTLLLSAAGAPRTAPARANADSKEETLNILNEE